LNSDGFLSHERLLRGPWQAFERDVARLMIYNGFDDVRIVGGSGDQGADVLGAKNEQLWVFQCKFTSSSSPPKKAVTEVVNAARYYKADRMVVAVTRPPSSSFVEEVNRYSRQGLKVETVSPKALLQLMSSSPEYPQSRRKLREYQEDASTLFREGMLETGRAQVVLATGLGKTVVMAETLADLFRDNLVQHGRALVVAHTRSLVRQLHQSFWHQLPKWLPTQHFAEGETPTYWDGITFATIQTVRSKLDDLPDFGVILVDEAHHIGAEMFRETIDRLDPPMLGGMTATPWRGDGYDIDQLLGPPLVRLGIQDGLQQGFLTEVDYRLMADNLDWAFVQKCSRYQYSLSQLNRKLILPTRDEQAARAIRHTFDEDGRRGGILYSPTIKHATHMAAMLRRMGLRSEAISTGIVPRDQDVLMSRFRAGKIDILTTVDMFNEGVDVPDVDLIVFMRATHSRRIFVQQLGRGLRLSPDKDSVVVLDFVSDLRRIAEVIELDRALRSGVTERLGLGSRIVQFRDESAGSFLEEWMLDQASLVLREDDPSLTVPDINFPPPAAPGAVQ